MKKYIWLGVLMVVFLILNAVGTYFGLADLLGMLGFKVFDHLISWVVILTASFSLIDVWLISDVFFSPAKCDNWFGAGIFYSWLLAIFANTLVICFLITTYFNLGLVSVVLIGLGYYCLRSFIFLLLPVYLETKQI